MAYTQTDLDNIKTAIIDLAMGERVVSITLNGKIVQYNQVDLNKLRELRKEIQTEIDSTADTQRFILIQTGKGL